MEMRIYLTNLGKYTEGEHVGAWFTPPIDEENMKERIGLHGRYEEYAIHTYELPFRVDEYTSISEINRLCEMVTELEGKSIYNELEAIQFMWFHSLDELLENVENIISHSDCNSMEDVARYYIDEANVLGEVSSELKMYIDYGSYGLTLETAGSFLVTNHGVFEYIG